MLVTVGYILFFVLIFYFLLIRPQQKQKKQKEQMLSQLNVGDRILTIGGMIATISKIKDDTVKVRLADNVEVEMLKSAIAGQRNNSEG